MIPPEQLVQTFKSNHWLACRHLEGLSHEESLLQPEFQANVLNWVLGHIINGRNEALLFLGKPSLWGDEQAGLYRTGSASLEASVALPLERLMADFDESQADLEVALAEASELFLSETVDTRFGERTRWQHISGLGWHETYHIGQLELLRQLAIDRRDLAE
jgi:DinB superfamily